MRGRAVGRRQATWCGQCARTPCIWGGCIPWQRGGQRERPLTPRQRRWAWLLRSAWRRWPGRPCLQGSGGGMGVEQVSRLQNRCQVARAVPDGLSSPTQQSPPQRQQLHTAAIQPPATIHPACAHASHATVLTMSATVQPRDRSFTGLARPCGSEQKRGQGGNTGEHGGRWAARCGRVAVCVATYRQQHESRTLPFPALCIPCTSSGTEAPALAQHAQQPRGLACMRGPMAMAPVDCCTALYVLLPVLRSGKMHTAAAR